MGLGHIYLGQACLMAQAPPPHGEVFWEEVMVLELGLAKVARGGETTVENVSETPRGMAHDGRAHGRDGWMGHAGEVGALCLPFTHALCAGHLSSPDLQSGVWGHQ